MPVLSSIRTGFEVVAAGVTFVPIVVAGGVLLGTVMLADGVLRHFGKHLFK